MINLTSITHNSSQENVLKLPACGNLSHSRWLHVRTLEVTACRIASLLSQSFEDVQSEILCSPNLQNNAIESIEKTTFAKFVNIVNLDISDNNLRALDEGIFDSLSALNVLSIARNTITSLNTALFKSIRKLYFINVADNFITDVFGGFAPIDPMYVLLNSNRLREIREETFQICSPLLYLDVG